MNQNGEEYKLSDALKKGPVVLTFYRGEWCPYCNRYLANVTDSLFYIQEKGASFIAISPEKEKNIMKMAEKVGDGISILSDNEGNVMKAYDVDFMVTSAYQNKIKMGLLTSIKKSNGQEAAILPVPATYIISKEGKIIYRYFDINYTQRAPISAILKALN